ncbi:MAG: type I DNA topoisomerase [Patescibacteria group bacterium]
MKLLIVESPTKAKTISGILKGQYEVVSSFGHVRDLPKSAMGIDVENGFAPHYVIPRDKSKRVNELKKLGKEANEIYFATDKDREGEAISWHLCSVMGINPEKAKRISFHEITDEAISEALNEPRAIDMDLVDAQQARRILDRLVGYELSPFLWKKVAKGLSAGRVQSAALRFIVEREREIKEFKPEEYWSVEAIFSKDGKDFEAKLHSFNEKVLGKMDLKSKEEVDKMMPDLNYEPYAISDLKEKLVKRQPLAPFTTSALQQEANKKFGFSAKQTMKIAQELYEGVNIGSGGLTGLITYMRTDSCTLSEKFIAQAKNWIAGKIGDKYVEQKTREFKTKTRSAQEAHEAIRPTAANRIPADIKEFLNKNQYKLYDLIWRRAMSTQAKAAIFRQTQANIKNGKAEFKANGNIMVFDGFLKIYGALTSEVILPELKLEEKLGVKKIEPKQHFTEPPQRYSDATLVKALEEHGIGRPSTYAPIISTLIARNYIERDKNKKFEPKEIAFMVNDMLVKNFPEIVDYQFTARVEDDLDEIAEGKKEWQPVISDFYNPFKKNLEEKYKEVKKNAAAEEKTDEVCELCGSPMVVRMSRYGKFLACSAFPKCKFTKPLAGKDEKKETEIKESDEFCSKCGAKMLVKQGKYGKFLGCSNYPNCKNMKPIKDETGIACPKCKTGQIVKRRTKRGKEFFGCSNYPNCDFGLWSRPTGEVCKLCGSLMVIDQRGKIKCSNKECKEE